VPSGVVSIPPSDHDVEVRLAELLHHVNEAPPPQAMQDRPQPRGLDVAEIALGQVDRGPGQMSRPHHPVGRGRAGIDPTQGQLGDDGAGQAGERSRCAKKR